MTFEIDSENLFQTLPARIEGIGNGPWTQGNISITSNDHMTRLDDFIDEKLKVVTFSKMVRR